jgi:hypothetical protein
MFIDLNIQLAPIIVPKSSEKMLSGYLTNQKIHKERE